MNTSLKRYLPLALAGLFYYSSLSRFSSGRYTSGAFYAYQTDRAPNDDTIQGWAIPTLDAVFATMLLMNGAIRNLAALATLGISVLGVWMRIDVGKDATMDVALTVLLALNALAVYA